MRANQKIKCVNCDKEFDIKLDTKPFCSKRCADIDLGRWLTGVYALPAVDAADDSVIDAELITSDKHG